MIESLTQTPPPMSMRTRCSHCGAEYLLGDTRLPPAGLSLQCSQCGNTFGVLPLVDHKPEQPQQAPQGPQFLVRQLSGAMYDAGDLATLRRWIAEGRVGRDDLLSQQGGAFVRLGNVADLVAAFGTAQPPAPQQVPLAVVPPETPAAAANDAQAGVEPPPPGPASTPLPRLTPKRLTRSKLVAPIMGDAARRHSRATGRRRTNGQSTYDLQLDRAFDESLPFSLPTDPRKMDNTVAQRRRGRNSLGLWAALLLLVGGPAALYVQRPDLARAAWDVLLHAKTSNLAASQVLLGYQALERDTTRSLAQAAEAFDRAVQIDARYSDARAGQAETYLAQAELLLMQADDAGRDAEAPRGSGTRDKLLAGRGEALHRAHGLLAQAAIATKQAVTLAPQGMTANRALAEYERLFDPSLRRSLPALARARAQAPDDPRLRGIEAAGLAFTKPDDAVAMLRAAIDAAPHNNRLRFRLARLYMRRGDKAHALSQIDTILRDMPEHEAAQALLAILQPSVGTPAPATMHQAPIATTAPLSAETSALPAAASTVGTPAAVSTASQAVVPSTVKAPAVMTPASMPALSATASYTELIAQAQAMVDRRMPAQAAVLYGRAIQREPYGAAAYLGLGYCKLDEHDAASAQAAFESALRNAPGSAAAHYGLAQAAALAGDKRNAEKHLRQVLVIAPDGSQSMAARRKLEELSK